MRNTCRVLLLVFMQLGPSSVAGASSSLWQDVAEVTSTNMGGDVDAVVDYPVKEVLEAVRLALATYGCDIKKDEPDRIECTRSRRIGIVVGSGGEKITVRLTAQHAATRVVIKTGKGFVGRLGKKNWSTPVFEETLKVLDGK